MKCPNCGEMLPVGAKFCGACGNRLADPVNMDAAKSALAEEVTASGYEKGPNAAERTAALDSAEELIQANVTAVPECAGDLMPTEEARAPEVEEMPAGSAEESRNPDASESQAEQSAVHKTHKNNVLPILLIAGIVFIIIAINVIIAMIPTDEERWQEQYDLGQQYLLELDYEQAIVAFTAAIEIDENNVEAYIGRAEAYIGDDVTDASEENLILALSDYETALSIDDTKAQVYADRGQVYQTLGSMEEALSDYNAALSLDASLVGIYACRGHVYLALGDPEAALNDYETAVELDAADGEVYLCAAQICMDLGDYDRAAEFLEKGETAYPDSEDIRELADDVAAILEEEGTRKRYQAYYDKLMELQEEYGEVGLHQGDYDWDCWLNGLCLAVLLDFDGNGEEELLLTYSTEDSINSYSVEVWGYEESRLVQLYTGEPYSIQTYRAVWVSCVDGEYYVVEGMADALSYFYCHGYSDGSFRLMKSIVEAEAEEERALFLRYLIDDAEVTQEDYEEIYETWIGGCTRYVFVDPDDPYDEHSLDPRVVLKETFTALREYLGYGDSTVDEAADDGEADNSDVSTELDWAAIYLNYLEALTPTENFGATYLQMNDLYYRDQFSLIYVNDDDIPELIMYGGYGYVSGLALTIDENGTVSELDLYRNACSYLPGENILDNNDVMSSGFHDRIYSIIDGQWTLLAEGSYYSNWDENDEMYYYNYTWDGISVTAAEYDVLVAEYLDPEESSIPDDSYTLEELKDALESQRQ